MTRRLPWKTAESPAGSSRPSVQQPRDSPRTTGIKRQAAAGLSSPSSAQSRLPAASRREVLGNREFTRSPSTSPPPEPPKEEFMIPGFDHDDGWRMVEDEFLAVARRFTTHLHRAEYARLRSLAASQNAEAILEVERPVVAGSRQSTEVRRRVEGKRRVARQQSVMGSANDVVPMTGLRGLLESPKKDRRSIGRGFGREGMKTRAGAGFGERIVQGEISREQPRREDTTGGETSYETELPPLPFSSSPRPGEATPSETSRQSRASVIQPRSARRPGTNPKKTVVTEIDDDDDDDPFGISRRKARREKSREQLRKTEPVAKAEMDTMPAFL